MGFHDMTRIGREKIIAKRKSPAGPDYSCFEEKPRHGVARGVSLGASGHRNVKPRRLVMDLAISFVSSYCTLYHLGLQASSRHRSIARDRRGSLLGHSSVNNSGRIVINCKSPIKADIERTYK